MINHDVWSKFNSSEPFSPTWIISPYLDDSPKRLAVLVKRAFDQSIRNVLFRLHAALGINLVFDCLANRLVILKTSDRELLVRLKATPFSPDDIDKEDLKAFERLCKAGLVLDQQAAFKASKYDRVPIEINSHCNFRCQFCPVAEDPLPKRFMTMEVYEIVIRRLAEAGIERITLNHYGEPSLDPLLVDRVRIANDASLQVDLFSNASRLDEERLGELAKIGNTCLIVNLPAIDQAGYKEITGWRHLDRVTQSLRAATELGMNVRVTINSPKSLSVEQRKRLRQQIYDQTGASASFSQLQTRAGSMSNMDYASPIRNAGRLSGCYRMLTKIAVNVDGMAFLCCQDYRQEYILGDLRSSSFTEIAKSDRAVQIRRWLFGADEPPVDFICRKCEETCSREQNNDRLLVGSESYGMGYTIQPVEFYSALPE